MNDRSMAMIVLWLGQLCIWSSAYLPDFLPGEDWPGAGANIGKSRSRLSTWAYHTFVCYSFAVLSHSKWFYLSSIKSPKIRHGDRVTEASELTAAVMPDY